LVWQLLHENSRLGLSVSHFGQLEWCRLLAMGALEMVAGTNKERILERLLKDHSQLLVQLEDVRRWIEGVSEWGMPRFGELGMQLERFREALAIQFADEEAVENSAAQTTMPDAASGLRNIAEQHNQLLERLGTLIDCLRAREPGYCSWQAAVQEVDDLMREIHDHERSEMSLMQLTLSASQSAN
jgi:hypothetical protein